jgi:Fe(3+) dicitrate transport protein
VFYAVACALTVARAAHADPPDADAGVASTRPAAPQAPATPTQAPADPPPAAVTPAPDPAPTPAPRRDPAPLVAPRVDVIGAAPRHLDRVPGTSTVVRREDIQQLAPQNAGDVLRTVPGINVVAEDGMGLRLNIGIRGLDPSRSRQVTVLEDGVPVTLNPYGSPELYYSPPIERMERVEVIRGSGQIMYGPRTIGGVINYITPDPPRVPTVGADLRYGAFGYFLAQAHAGATHGAFGWRLDAIHRRFEGARRLDLALTDIAFRLRVAITPRSVLNVKLNFYDEDSVASYVGVTTPQFAADPNLMAPRNDHFGVRRYALAMSHQHAFTNDLSLRTTLYAYQNHREWRRQLFDRTGMLPDDQYDYICDAGARCGAAGTAGLNPTRDGGSLFFLRGAAIRDRRFDVFGVEPRLTWAWTSGDNLAGELIATVRVHAETADEQLRRSTIPTVDAGTPTDAELRNGYAISAAVQHRFAFWDRLFITPGLRVEAFWTDRTITRQTTVDAMGQSVTTDANIRGTTNTVALIPGLGVAYAVTPQLTLFTGVHRGYAPPRTKDAVNNTGLNLRLDPELSWNTELGARLRVGRWLNAEVAGFWIEFLNEILPPSEYGAQDAGAGFNNTQSRHIGLEASLTLDLATALARGTPTWALPIVVNYTWVPDASVVGGLYDRNRLPYAPEHILNAQLCFVHQSGISAQIGVNHVSSQFSDKDNTVVPSADGLVGRMDSYTTLNARVGYTVRPTGLTFYVAGNNIANDPFIANRAPQGAQPSGYRQVFGGIEWSWPRPVQQARP